MTGIEIKKEQTFDSIKIRKGRGYAFLVAIFPIVMMYEVPLVGIGFSTFLVIISAFYATFIVLMGARAIQTKLFLPIIIYIAYVLLKTGWNVNSIILYLSVAVHLFAISTGILKFNHIKRYIVLISSIASIFVIIQTIFHYLFGGHIPLIAIDLCLDEMEQYRLSITTGLSTASGNLYRPSAFFLEPSHFAQYVFIGLAFCLFGKTVNIKKTILLTTGILLTTSGMGIVMVACVWGWYVLTVVKGTNILKKIIRFFLFGIIAVIVIVFLLQIPLIQNALGRIFAPMEYSMNSYNAIWGRTLYWDRYITSLSGMDKWFGKGFSELPDVYFTGLMKMLFCYGIVGTTLFYLSLFPFIRNKSGMVVCIALMIGGLMVFANLSGFISLILYFGVMLSATPRKLEGA